VPSAAMRRAHGASLGDGGGSGWWARGRICHAINRMHAGGFRSLPIVDEGHRAIGIITVNDVVRWLAEIFPEAVLNQRPGDRLKNVTQIDAG